MNLLMRNLDFETCLENTQEVGYVVEMVHSLVYVSGLPGVKLNETIVFESGDLGQVFLVDRDKVGIFLMSEKDVKVNDRAARADEPLKIPLSGDMFGRLLDPLFSPLDGGENIIPDAFLPINRQPPTISQRLEVDSPLKTGVSLVDLVIPLSKGQRELVLGDRKTGKTEFLMATMLNQARLGTKCIYAIIGQKKVEIRRLFEFFKSEGAANNTLMIASDSSSPAGEIFITPYSAMTAAEYLAGMGEDVLLILDDMTTHARVYREISLLAKRFPGRGAYPGDIFYIHSKLLERSGKFKTGSITTIPVAESTLGDISGYIQTNLMAMTDGHIFFDISLYNEGKRPAVNPFLSVTRVGHQTQTPLEVSASRELLSFLVTYERMKQFMHFGAEVGKTVKNILTLGERIDIFLDQTEFSQFPVNINLAILAGIWTGIWNDIKSDEVVKILAKLRDGYQKNKPFTLKIDELVRGHFNFSDLVNTIRRDQDLLAV